jgi:hypothetical protein
MYSIRGFKNTSNSNFIGSKRLLNPTTLDNR